MAPGRPARRAVWWEGASLCPASRPEHQAGTVPGRGGCRCPGHCPESRHRLSQSQDGDRTQGAEPDAMSVASPVRHAGDGNSSPIVRPVPTQPAVSAGGGRGDRLDSACVTGGNRAATLASATGRLLCLERVRTARQRDADRPRHRAALCLDRVLRRPRWPCPAAVCAFGVEHRRRAAGSAAHGPSAWSGGTPPRTSHWNDIIAHDLYRAIIVLRATGWQSKHRRAACAPASISTRTSIHAWSSARIAGGRAALPSARWPTTRSAQKAPIFIGSLAAPAVIPSAAQPRIGPR